MDTIAKIRAKGLDSTGVTEEIAAHMYRSKGASYLAIVEVKVAELHEKSDGQRRVDLTLEMVEPVLDGTLEDHLRELTRVLYRNRAQDDAQLAIDDSLAPSVDEILAAGNKHKPHGYMASTLSTEDEPVCEVCGLTEEANLHHMPSSSPFQLIDGGGEPVPELAEWEQELLDAEEPTDDDPEAS